MCVCVCVCVCVCTSEGEANVTLDESEVSVFEDAGSAMFCCASLTLTDGFTLETTIIADFNVDIGDTGTLCVCVCVCVCVCNTLDFHGWGGCQSERGCPSYYWYQIQE